MTPTETAAILRQFNKWLRGNEDGPQLESRMIRKAIDAAVEMIDRLEATEKERDALRGKIEEMERQAPVGEIRDANELGIAQYADIWPCLKAKDKLYALLGAKPPPSVPKGWIQRGMAELEAIRSRQDDDTLLDDRTLIERIGKAMLAAAQEAKP